MASRGLPVATTTVPPSQDQHEPTDVGPQEAAQAGAQATWLLQPGAVASPARHREAAQALLTLAQDRAEHDCSCGVGAVTGVALMDNNIDRCLTLGKRSMHEEETKSKTEADANEHHLETAVTSARPTVTSAVLLAGEAGKEKLTRTRHEAIQEGWGRDVARDKRARSAVRTTRAESRLAEERARVPTEAGESHAVTENMKMKDPVGVESCPESGASCAASVTEPAAENPQPAQLDYMELPQLLCLKDRTGIVLGDMLGGGSFGTVYEASLKGSQWPAWLLELDLVVKVVRDNASGNGGGGVSRGRVFDEFVLGSVRHPSLVSCLGFTQSSPFWALFERCDCGSLWKALKGSRRSEAKARLLEEVRSEGVRLVVQLAEGISCLHGQGLLHCDLHEKNILLHYGKDRVLKLRIADFGLCTRVSDRRSHKLIRPQERETYRKQRPHHIAPELITGGDYSSASDMWAVGFIAEKLLGLDRWTGNPTRGGRKTKLSFRALQSIGKCSSPEGAVRPAVTDFLNLFRSEL